MVNYRGLKRLRCGKGPQDPNQYWKRMARPRCLVCGKKIRGINHAKH